MINFGNKQLCEYCLNENGGEPCRYCGYDKNTYKKELAVLPPGSALMGKYIVGRVIGKGGFGITYLAYDIIGGKKVALKEFYPISYAARTDDGCTVAVSRSEDTSLYQGGMKKFYDEASLVSKFNGNPNIVSVYEFFYENGTAYFVMELLRGYSLKSYVDKHGCLTPEQALYVADRVSNALMVAHSSNTLHRDIAPDNIMICTDGNVKLIDFGAARQVSAEDQKSLSVILKQGFAPLEQYQKHGKQGPWTDLYSLGATLYYALTKKCIDDPMTRLDNDEEFQSNPCNVEPQLWEIIKHATDLKIDDRYKDAFEFRADLNKIAYKAQEIKAEEVEPESAPMPAVGGTGIPQSISGTGVPQSISGTGIPQSVNSTGIPQSTQPMGGTGIPQPSQTVQPYTGYTGMTGQNAPPQNTYTPYSNQSNSYIAPPPPVKKPASKGKIFGIIGGIVGLVAIIGIVIGVSSSSSSTSKPPDEPSTSSTTTTTTTTTTKPAEPETPTEVRIGGTAFSVTMTRLDLSDMKLYNGDIDGLKYFTNLEWLELNENNISDLSVLSGLTSLKHLYFRNNSVSSLDFVSGLKNLEELNFFGNNISDISPIAYLTDLTVVWAGNNPITSIEPLRNLINVQSLSLRSTSFGGDISPLSGMKFLVEIDLCNCGVTRVSELSGCRDLMYIDLSYNSVYDIAAFKDCREIKELLLQGDYIGTKEQLDVFNDSLFQLSFAEDATVDTRDTGWYYSNINYALQDKQRFLNALKAKGYSTDKFEFWTTWVDDDGNQISDMV